MYKPVAIVGSATHSLEEVQALMLATEQGKFEEMLELQMVHQSPSTGLSVGRLTEFAEQIGMDASAFREHLVDGRFDREVRRNRQVYMDLQLTGVPAVILEGRLVFPRSRSVGCLSHFIEQELAAKGITEPPAAPTSAPAGAPAEGTSN